MALRTYKTDAWEDIVDLQCPNVDDARESAECARAYVGDAWEEVWGSSYEVGYTLGGFATNLSGISVNSDEVRMGYKIGSSQELSVSRELGVYIYGNFTNPVISCDVTLTCGSTTVMKNTTCGFEFYLNDSKKSTRNVVGSSSTSATLSGSLSGHTQEGTFDKIFLCITTYIESTLIRSKTVKAVISNLTIDGKKIADDFVVGSSTYYS